MNFSNRGGGPAHDDGRPHFVKVAKARRLLARLDREALEAVAEAAIDMLNEMSDPDEDCCEAGDDGCGAIWSGDDIGWLWGSNWEDEAHSADFPEYGADQREIMEHSRVVFRVE